MVRYRKLQLLFITIILVLLCCTIVGVVIFFVGRPGF